MERSFILGIVVLIVLTAFTQGSPIREENDSDLMRRNSLLEKLGMELHRDPFYSPSRKRGYWGWRPRRRYRKRKERRGSGTSASDWSSGSSGGDRTSDEE